MKNLKTRLCRYGLFLPLMLFVIMLLQGPAHAATFCVSTANELATALFTAASNGEDDFVQVVQGTYESNFVYTSQEPRDLTIEGGYTAGCSSRTVDAANTVLDSMGTGTVLALISTQEATFAVDGLTMQHGLATNGNGGGLFASPSGGDLTLTNTTFSGNTANSDGGGVYVSGGTSVTLTNNTLSENTANSAGGGVWLQLSPNDASADIYNNIVWANSAPHGADLYLDNDGNGDFIASPINLFCNDFDHSTIYRKVFFPIDASNLDNQDPLFVDAANSDYHLQEGSPVIDKGCNDAPERPDTDKDGLPRVVNEVVDMGAYEYQEVSVLPDIDVDPTSLDFGDVVVGACRDQVVTITNRGMADLVVNSVATDTSALTVITPSFPQTIAPEANIPVTVRFCPADLGAFSGALTIDSNDPDEPTLKVPCDGTGIGPACDADGDGDVDLQDAIAVLKYLWKGAPLLGDGDCNQDGQITFRDVLAIIKASR